MATKQLPPPLSPTKSPRVPLQEALLNLARDGSCPPSMSDSSFTSTAPPLLAHREAPTVDGAENPFIVKGLAAAAGKKRKVTAGEENEMDGGEGGTKRARVDREPNANESTLAPALGKIDFLSLKRTREPDLSTTDDELDDSASSPRKRSKPSFATTTPVPHIDLFNPPPSPTRTLFSTSNQGIRPPSPVKFTSTPLPHIDLANPPPSPARPKCPPSPTKFNHVPQLEMSKSNEKEKEKQMLKEAIDAGSKKAVVESVKPQMWAASKPIKPLPVQASPPKQRTLADEMQMSECAIDPALLAEEMTSKPKPETLPAAKPAPYIPFAPIVPVNVQPRPSPGIPDMPSSPPPPTSNPTSPPSRQPISRLPVRASRLPRAAPNSYKPPPNAPAPTAAPSSYKPPPGLSRTTSMSSETQASLSTLSAALSKLALPPPPPGKSFSRQSLSASVAAPAAPSAGAPKKRQSSAAPPSRRSSMALGRSTSTAAGVGDVSFSTGRETAPLAGCVVFVDVRTKDGDDAGGVFIDMLKSLGARVLKSPTPSLTHLVLKSPLPSTISRFYALPEPRPEPVAVGWVVKCAEEGKRVAVDGWRLELRPAVPGGGAGRKSVGMGGPGGSIGASNRRKSMEPRRVELLDEVSLSAIIPPMQEKIERVKRRSMLYQPKIGSPLRGVYIPPKDEDDEKGFGVEMAGKGKARA